MVVWQWDSLFLYFTIHDKIKKKKKKNQKPSDYFYNIKVFLDQTEWSTVKKNMSFLS